MPARKKKQRKKKATQKDFINSVPSGLRPPSWMTNPEDKKVKVVKQQFVHQWLFRRWKLTSTMAWRNFGITRLADLIWRMRKKGVKIQTINTRGIDRFGNKVHYATYKYISGKKNFLKK